MQHHAALSAQTSGMQRKTHGLRGFTLMLAALAVAGCTTMGALPTSPLRDILQARIAAGSGDGAAEAAQALAFYELRNFRPAWTGGKEQEDAAAQVRAVLQSAEQQGLSSADYAVPADAASADYEIAVTQAVMRYARHVRMGRVRPNEIYKDAGLPVASFDTATALQRALRMNAIASFLAELPPPHVEYRRLADGLATYRRIAGNGGFRTIRALDESNAAQRKALYERLAAEDAGIAADATPIPRSSSCARR
jgi:murein L,D-transpeptidase YcbB/YkuD